MLPLRDEESEYKGDRRAPVALPRCGRAGISSSMDPKLPASMGISFCSFGSSLAITLYLMKKDPKLLERRMRAGPGAEKEKSQKIVMSLASAGFIALIVVSALDHRFAWSALPPYTALAGDVLVALGYLTIFFVFKENTFTSATIEVDPQQKVISTGPYALVRHPMYAGSIVMLTGIPLALGSWWGLFIIILMMPALIWASQ